MKLIRLALIIFLLTSVVMYPSTENVFLLKKENESTYTTMTYNIHRGTTKYNVPSLPQIVSIIKTESPDFIALQEVDRFHVRSGLQDQIKWLSEQLNMYDVFGANLRFGITEYGNAILSKFPIIDWGQIDLAYEKEPRSLLWAKVKTEDGYIYLTSIHLGLDTRKRKEHLDIIEKFIETKKDAPILIMGDFNTLPNHQDFSQFRNTITGKLFHQEVTSYFKYDQPVQIDYIFGRGIRDFEIYNIPSNASDHFPLILKFRFYPSYNQEQYQGDLPI